MKYTHVTGGFPAFKTPDPYKLQDELIQKTYALEDAEALLKEIRFYANATTNPTPTVEGIAARIDLYFGDV